MNTEKKQSSKVYSDIKMFLLNNKALLILVVLFIVASIGSDVFLTGDNLMNVVRQVAVSIVLGMGEAVLSGGRSPGGGPGSRRPLRSRIWNDHRIYFSSL